MKKPTVSEKCEEFPFFVSLLFCGVFVFVVFFCAVGLIVAVMVILLALPIDWDRSLWDTKNGYFMKVLF